MSNPEENICWSTHVLIIYYMDLYVKVVITCVFLALMSTGETVTLKLFCWDHWGSRTWSQRFFQRLVDQGPVPRVHVRKSNQSPCQSLQVQTSSRSKLPRFARYAAQPKMSDALWIALRIWSIDEILRGPSLCPCLPRRLCILGADLNRGAEKHLKYLSVPFLDHEMRYIRCNGY